MSSWSLFVTVLPKRCGTVSWKLPLPGEKEWLGNYWGVIILNGGKIGGGSLSGWFTAKQGWLTMRLSGGDGREWEKSTTLNRTRGKLLRSGMCTVLKLECYLSYRPRQANGSAIRTRSLWRGQKYNIYTSLSLQNSLWTSAFTCETPNCWLCVYVVKKDRASLLTKCFKKIWQRCDSEASLSNYIPSLTPFLYSSFSFTFFFMRVLHTSS